MLYLAKIFWRLLQEILKVFKKIFLILVILVVLTFGGLSVYVSTIDWNLHKNKIAKQFEEISGKKIVFEGPVSLSFFPVPYLSAKDIKVYNKTGENTNQPLASIQEMVTYLSLIPLIQGNFVINNMSLIKSDIMIEFLQNGKLNWYSEITDFQKNKLDTVEVSLNSVLLKDSVVHILNKGLNIDVNLQELNAEITAESLFGPYRIDGNFVKDNNPAGFALNLGTLSENFATSLNLVLTHPTTESYARFDGSMLSSNKEIKGNFVLESKKPSNFINELTNQLILPEEFNYPLACSIELITNEQQIDLSNFVIKYGDNTTGAGNIIIPLKPNPDEERRKVEASFEMTDLDLMPIIGIIKEQIKKFDNNQKPYTLYSDFDMIADIKAVKANFNDQPIRNFDLSVDFIDNILTVKKLSGLLSGDTDMSVNGDVFENEQLLTYNFNIKAMSQDFLKFLELINIKPQIYAQSTYRNASVNLAVSGNLNKINITPFSFTVDKTNMFGSIGLVRDARKSIFLNLEIDNINFDNYIPSFTEEEKALPINEKIKLILNKLSFLNDYDIAAHIKLGLGIYNNSSFEKNTLSFISDNDVVKIEKLNIENINDALFNMSGDILEMSDIPHFKDVKYNFKTSKMTNFLKKVPLDMPFLQFIRETDNLNAKGIVTGDINGINIKAVTTSDKLSSVYSGRLYNENNQLNYKGSLEFRSADFVDFINRIGFNYRPQYITANIFTFKGNIEGNSQKWSAKDIDAFVGSNNFKGDISVINDGYPQINATMHANKFEFDRFIYNPENSAVKSVKKTKTVDNSLNFLEQPVFDTIPINYDIYKKFDLAGKFSADIFSIKNKDFENVSAGIEIKKGLITIDNITAQIKDAPIKANVSLDVNSAAKIKGNFEIQDYDVSKIGGKRYEFLSGKVNSNIKFEAPVSSAMNFIKGLNASVSMDFTDTKFKGWNLLAIEEDVRHRTHSDNLYDMLRTNLQNGESLFYRIVTDFDIKDGNISIVNSLLETEQAKIIASGMVNLSDWTINSDFTLTFNQLKDKIVPIEYQWTGSLNNPNVVINSLALKNKYDSYWEKVRIEKEIAEKNRQKDLQKRMSVAQEKVSELLELIDTEIFPRFKKYSQTSSNAISRANYKSINIVAQDMKFQLEELQQRAKQDFDEEDIDVTNTNTEIFDTQLADLDRELDENYIADLKNISNGMYDNINNIYVNSLKKGISYQDTLDVYVKRLIEIKSLIILDNEPQATDYKNKIETSLRSIANLHNKALGLINEINNSNKIKEIELDYQMIKEILEKTNSEIINLNSSVENLFEYAKNIVRLEEDEALKKQLALKAVQEGEPLADDKSVLPDKSALIEESSKIKSKIMIVEEGQKTDNELKVKEDVNVSEKNTTSLLSEPPLLIKVNDVQTDMSKQPEKTVKQSVRKPFITEDAAQQNNEDIKNTTYKKEHLSSETEKTGVLRVSEDSKKESVLLQNKESKIEEQIEQKPIIKAIDNTVAYKSKMATSGIITKPLSPQNKNKTVENTEKTESFLKISTGAEIVSKGTITKRK